MMVEPSRVVTSFGTGHGLSSTRMRRKIKGRGFESVIGKAAMTMTALGSALVLVGLAVGAYQFIAGKWKPVTQGISIKTPFLGLVMMGIGVLLIVVGATTA
jgi:hypothetical protein